MVYSERFHFLGFGVNVNRYDRDFCPSRLECPTPVNIPSFNGELTKCGAKVIEEGDTLTVLDGNLVVDSKVETTGSYNRDEIAKAEQQLVRELMKSLRVT